MQNVKSLGGAILLMLLMLKLPLDVVITKIYQYHFGIWPRLAEKLEKHDASMRKVNRASSKIALKSDVRMVT